MMGKEIPAGPWSLGHQVFIAPWLEEGTPSLRIPLLSLSCDLTLQQIHNSHHANAIHGDLLSRRIDEIPSIICAACSSI